MKAFSQKDLRHPIPAPGRSSAIISRRNDRHREPGDRRPARIRCVEFGRRYRFRRRPFSAGRVSTSEPGLHRLQRSSKM